MVVDIILKGDPRSTSHIYKAVCRGQFPSVYMSKQGKDLKEDYQWQIKSQYKGRIHKGEVDLIVKLYFGTKRSHDIDNYNKLVLDACSGLVWEDDAQVQSMMVSKHYDKGNGRVELIIDCV